MVIDLINLDRTQQQLKELLAPIVGNILAFRGDSRHGRYDDWEVACHDASFAQDSWDKEVHKYLFSKDVLIRAYHGTRLKNPDLIYKQGLQQVILKHFSGKLFSTRWIIPSLILQENC